MVEYSAFNRLVPGSSPGLLNFLRILHNGSVFAFQAKGAGSIPAIRFYMNRYFIYIKYNLICLIFGEMAEWFNALVLKTNVKKFTEGSNPSLSCMV